MYEYLSKPSAGKSKGANSASDAKQNDTRSFSGLSENQDSRDGKYLMDKSFHEKVFGKHGKAVIHDDPKNSAERISADDSRAHFNSDKPAQMRASAYTTGADDRSERKSVPSEPVVQRMRPRKPQKKSTPRDLWNSISQKLCEILPAPLQAGFMDFVRSYRPESFQYKDFQPQDGDFVEMVNKFVEIITTGYLDTDYELGTYQQEAERAGITLKKKEGTGGHSNVEEDVTFIIYKIEKVSYRTGITNAHGIHKSDRKTYKKDKEEKDEGLAKFIRQNSIVQQAGEVCRFMDENDMKAVSNILFNFVTTYVIR